MGKETNWGKLINTVEFLDKVRWQDEYNYLSHWKETVNRYVSLPMEEKMLVHWLSYLANRQTDAHNIWRKGGAVENNILLVKEYKRIKSEEEVDSLLNKFSRYIVFGRMAKLNLKEISCSLKKLFRYSNRSLLKFFEYRILEWGRENREIEVGMYLANSLYDLRNTTPESNPYFYPYERVRQFKRIWCVLRDFKKWKVFADIPKFFSFSQARKIWKEKFTENQLELPIDRHIIRVFSYLILPLKNLPPLSEDNPLSYVNAARKIYPYPERFDVFWNIGRDLCKTKKCRECIFGGGEILSLCTPSNQACEVVKALFNWESYCLGKECPLKEVQGVCSEARDLQISASQVRTEPSKKRRKERRMIDMDKEIRNFIDGYKGKPYNHVPRIKTYLKWCNDHGKDISRSSFREFLDSRREAGRPSYEGSINKFLEFKGI